MDASELLSSQRIVPVVVIEREEDAVPIAEALWQGGLTAIEVTLRSAAALDAIRAIVAAVPALLVGAGSVRTAAELEAVKQAGARFAVSPGHTDALISAAQRSDTPLVPGVATPSEAMALHAVGYQLQKLFPAEVIGGLDWLRSIAGPLPAVQFFPTGGIRLPQVAEYLRQPNVACIGGTWLTPTRESPPDLEAITARAAEALKVATAG